MMIIRNAGMIIVGPATERRRWFGLRRERIPESTFISGWWIEGDEAMPHVFRTRWDEFVAAAQETGNYVDYREGTDRYGTLPEGMTVC